MTKAAIAIVPLAGVYQHCLENRLSCADVERMKRSPAYSVQSSYARALLAVRLLIGSPVWSDGYERRIDDCFEMGDGDNVIACLVAFADADPQVLKLLEGHHNTAGSLPHWRARVAKLREDELPLQLA